MIEQDRKILARQLNALMDLLWRNGISGSEESIDLITFLFLFKSLDTPHLHSGITWDIVMNQTIDISAKHLIEEAKLQIDQVAGYGLTGPFDWNISGQMLFEAMRIVDEIVNNFQDKVSFGYIFDILGTTIAKRKMMPVFTPLRLANTLVRMVDLQKSDLLVDPSCGIGSFLIASLPFSNHIQGFDINAFSVRISRANLFLNGATSSEVSLTDALDRGLDYAESRANVVLTNPPFSMKMNNKQLSNSILFVDKKKQTSEILFLWRTLSLLKPGGRSAIILPESFFFSEMYAQERKHLFKMALVDGIVSLPRGMFKSSAQLKTSVLLFRRKESHTSDTEYVWFYEMNSEDLSQSENGSPEEEDIFHNLLIAWGRRQYDADQWFKAKYKTYPFLSYPLSHVEKKNITFVSYNEIVNENYYLNLSNYSYMEPHTETFGDPHELFREVLDLEEQIAEGLREIMDQSRWISETMDRQYTDAAVTVPPSAIESLPKEKDYYKIMMDITAKERRQQMKKHRESIDSNLGWFLDELAEWQKKLLNQFYKSTQPLAAHEAAKKIIGVQIALQTILLFESFGILERTLHTEIKIPSFNEVENEATVVDRQGKPLSMHRWQPAISYMEGRNL
ncbi:HsdM family class I SAM-dependent methyltransferase [Paenibacillus radicis (ex Xue et al. 2023)]|uniref:site-specific DNA-methyltransferase (adenine-specific) n=1 Tax=Paenibacillus radicis (ex Xue et al. 2023) TaxID=2972489 RepID=A0ABT1YJ27_9BACL|nr:SAM-dependent methyltransferase [Paenibacillus radicis (ex Xue et al. 2023)]MCR8633198.1 SAM-dependent methyltransferase [Paenibacillus radicis (ex Xue et al. 2023)]